MSQAKFKIRFGVTEVVHIITLLGVVAASWYSNTSRIDLNEQHIKQNSAIISKTVEKVAEESEEQEEIKINMARMEQKAVSIEALLNDISKDLKYLTRKAMESEK